MTVRELLEKCGTISLDDEITVYDFQDGYTKQYEVSFYNNDAGSIELAIGECIYEEGEFGL